MKKNKTLSAFIICCFCSVLTFAQQFSADEKRVFDSQNVIFYGYDFSHFKLADAHFEYGWSVKKNNPSLGRISESSYHARIFAEKI